ncbi:MAG: hypothetical protein LZF60_110043 [Nitrospira sp.]|nr:MAG: hypothetical protein LZF60_110043 [Nitrospira sp.]
MSDGPEIVGGLTTAQRRALQHAHEVSDRNQCGARERLREIFRKHGCSDASFHVALRSLREHARVVVHFHPDRRGMTPITVVEGMLRDGRYRNQFETGRSSGSRTAVPGGARDEWERALFGSAYHVGEVSAEERPKYGALEIVRFPDGPIPRFGSCYLVLRPAVSRRTSFTFSGSEQQDAAERLGMMDHLDPVLASLMTEISEGTGARVGWPPFRAPTLGIEALTVPRFLDICQSLGEPRSLRASGPPGRVLDSCIEAQVHGPIDLASDVECVVVDPAFDGTRSGELLIEIAKRYGIEIAYHQGFRMAAREVPEDFRGPVMPVLALRVAQDGIVDAATIGAAEAALWESPDAWRDIGTRAEMLQYLKQLWHVLVHYGQPADELSNRLLQPAGSGGG